MLRDDMLERISSTEITDQMAYDLVELEDHDAAMEKLRVGAPLTLGARPTPAEVTRKLLAWRRGRRRRKAPPSG